MRDRRDGAKLRAIAAVGAREALAQRGELFGRAGFLLVLLVVFSSIWEAVMAKATDSSLTAAQMVWYLALTEWVILSLPDVHLRIERDVRSGDIAYELARPVDYLGARFAEAAGTMAVRMIALGATALLGAWALSGSLPERPLALLAALPTGMLAALLGLSFLSGIGLFAIWLEDVQPLYWVWQKFAFILGGLILPIDIYPAWLRSVAEWTPFHAFLYGVGRWALAFDWTQFLFGLGALGGWLTLVAGGSIVILRRGLRRLDVNGG